MHAYIDDNDDDNAHAEDDHSGDNNDGETSTFEITGRVNIFTVCHKLRNS